MKKKSTPKSILLRDKAEELTEKSVIKNIVETAKAGTNEAGSTKLHHIDSNILGLFTALFEGKIIEINDYFLNILGFSRADFETGLIDWLALTPPEWSKADEVAQHELREKGKCSPYEKEFICKNGSRIDVLITGELLPGPEEHIAAFVLDITEHKKNEKALKESEKHFRLLTEEVSDVIWKQDSNNCFTYLSPADEKVRGYKAEEMIGRHVTEVLTPEGVKVIKNKMKQRWEAEQKGIRTDTITFEAEQRCKDGSSIWTEVISTAERDEANNITGYHGISRNISERKHTENINNARLRLLEFATSHSAIELLQATLDELELLTASNVGFCHFVEDDQETLSLQSWSTKTLQQMCKALEAGFHNDISQAGVWADCARERKALIHNNFAALPNKKGMPEGHTTINRELIVPVFRGEKIVAILGLGNKPTDYTDKDISTVSELANLAWDVISAKKTEEKLKLSEEKYRTLFETMSQGAFYQFADGSISDVNQAALNMLGLTRDQILSRTSFHPEWKVIDEQGAIIPPEKHPSMIGLQTGKHFEQIVGVYNPSQKTYRWLIVNVIPHFNPGEIKPDHVFVTIHDITERKKFEQGLRESELKYHELFEANTDGITIFNISPQGPPSLIIDLNENAAKMVGYTKDEMKLMSPNEFEKDLTLEKVENRKHDLLLKGFSSFETIILHKDGHEIAVEIKVLMINYYNQPALMNITRDITDRKNSETQLQKYAIELNKQIAEKDKFFSIIAHDLRGPFNGFLELTELIADGSLNLPPKEIQRIAATMKKSATNLYRLLSNLLEWSRMQRGITTYSPRPLNVNSKIFEILGFTAESATKKGIEVSCSIPEDLVVFADENMLDGIFRNLIANAVKYTTTGGKIIISANPVSGNMVEFSIKDTGIGMNKTILDNLFNIDVNTSRKGTAGELSTGLGLLICKDFIEKHNGTLRIESQPESQPMNTVSGKHKKTSGSTFYFTIPGVQKTEVKTGKNNPGLTEARKLKILLAEDDETSDLLLSISLDKISSEILHAKTGAEAVDLCRHHPDIDLIMMDIKMPEINGYEAARQIREFNKDIIIIVQTAFGLASERQKAIEAGCNDYLLKPISMKDLTEAIEHFFTLKNS